MEYTIVTFIIQLLVLPTLTLASEFAIYIYDYHYVIQYHDVDGVTFSTSTPMSSTSATKIDTSSFYARGINSANHSISVFNHLPCANDNRLCKINHWFTLTNTLALIVFIAVKVVIIKACCLCYASYYARKATVAKGVIADAISGTLPSAVKVIRNKLYREPPYQDEDDQVVPVANNYRLVPQGEEHDSEDSGTTEASLKVSFRLFVILAFSIVHCLSATLETPTLMFNNPRGMYLKSTIPNTPCRQSATNYGMYLKSSKLHYFIPNYNDKSVMHSADYCWGCKVLLSDKYVDVLGQAYPVTTTLGEDVWLFLNIWPREKGIGPYKSGVYISDGKGNGTYHACDIVESYSPPPGTGQVDTMWTFVSPSHIQINTAPGRDEIRLGRVTLSYPLSTTEAYYLSGDSCYLMLSTERDSMFYNYYRAIDTWHGCYSPYQSYRYTPPSGLNGKPIIDIYLEGSLCNFWVNGEADGAASYQNNFNGCVLTEGPAELTTTTSTTPSTTTPTTIPTTTTPTTTAYPVRTGSTVDPEEVLFANCSQVGPWVVIKNNSNCWSVDPTNSQNIVCGKAQVIDGQGYDCTIYQKTSYFAADFCLCIGLKNGGFFPHLICDSKPCVFEVAPISHSESLTTFDIATMVGTDNIISTDVKVPRTVVNSFVPAFSAPTFELPPLNLDGFQLHDISQCVRFLTATNFVSNTYNWCELAPLSPLFPYVPTTEGITTQVVTSTAPTSIPITTVITTSVLTAAITTALLTTGITTNANVVTNATTGQATTSAVTSATATTQSNAVITQSTAVTTTEPTTVPTTQSTVVTTQSTVIPTTVVLTTQSTAAETTAYTTQSTVQSTTAAVTTMTPTTYTTQRTTMSSTTKKPKPECVGPVKLWCQDRQLRSSSNINTTSSLALLLAIYLTGWKNASALGLATLVSSASSVEIDKLLNTPASVQVASFYGDQYSKVSCRIPEIVEVKVGGNPRCLGLDFDSYVISDSLCYAGHANKHLSVGDKQVLSYSTNGLVNVYKTTNVIVSLCQYPTQHRSLHLQYDGLITNTLNNKTISSLNETLLQLRALSAPFVESPIANDAPAPDYILYNVQIVPITETGEVILPHLYSMVLNYTAKFTCVSASAPLPNLVQPPVVYMACSDPSSSTCTFYYDCVADAAGVELNVYTVSSNVLPGAAMYTDGAAYFTTLPANTVECFNITEYLQSGIAPAGVSTTFIFYEGSTYGILSSRFVRKNLIRLAGRLFVVNYMQATSPEFGNQFGFDGLECTQFIAGTAIPSYNTYNRSGVLGHCLNYDIEVGAITYITYQQQFYVSGFYQGLAAMVAINAGVYDNNALYVKPSKTACNTAIAMSATLGVNATSVASSVYSGSYQRPILACFDDMATPAFTPTTFSEDIFSVVYTEMVGYIKVLPFVNLPVSITEFGFNTNWTLWHGACNPKFHNGCYTESASYESSETSSYTVEVVDRPVINPLPIGTDAIAEQPIASTTTSSSPCLGSGSNIQYYNCQYVIAFWCVIAIMIALLLSAIIFFIVTLCVRSMDRKIAIRLYKASAKSAATVMYYGKHDIVRYIRGLYKSKQIADIIKIDDDIDTTPYKILTDSVVYPGRKNNSTLLASLRIVSFANLLVLALATTPLVMQNQVLYKTNVKVAEVLASTGAPWQSTADYSAFDDKINHDSFIQPVGTKSNSVTGSSYTCEANGDCSCRIDASIGVTRLIPGSTLSFKAKCDTITTMVTMRVSTVFADYKPEYQYSTTDVEWTTEQTYSCSGSCSGRNCLTIKPGQGYPFYSNLKSELGRTVGVNCCYWLNVGYGLAGAAAKPKGTVYTHVYKYVLGAYNVNYCLQGVTGINCYDSAVEGPISFSIANVGLPSTFTVGHVFKNGAYLRSVFGAFTPQNTPQWRHFADIQFNGFTEQGMPTKLVYSDADPVVWGTWRYRGCFIPSLSKHDKNWIDMITVPEPAGLLVLNEMNYPRIQDNTYGVRFRNISISYAAGTPLVPISVEAVTPSGTATVLYSAILNIGNIKTLFAEAVEELKLHRCYFTVGSNVNSNCTLSISWKQSPASFMASLVTDDEFYSRVVDTIILTSDVTEWHPRFNVYNTQTSVTLHLNIGGVTVATLTTNDVSYVKPGGVDQTEDIIDGNVPSTGGNTSMTWQNILIITAACVAGAIILILLIVAIVYCSKRKCCAQSRVQ